MKILPNTKIKIVSKDHSEYVQKLAFESGFNWQKDSLGHPKAKHKNKPYLFFKEDLNIKHGLNSTYFYEQKEEEIFIAIPVKKPRHRMQANFDSRVLAEKVGFKELCPVCSSNDWAEREAETYDDLRDAHLEALHENLDFKNQVEGLEKEVKRLQRKINDVRCNLDD